MNGIVPIAASLPMDLPPFNPAPLIDGDLQLVFPQARYIPEVLTAARDPLTLRDAPEFSRLTRPGLMAFLEATPLGRQPGITSQGSAPTLHYWMRLSPPRPLAIAGAISLRLGDSDDLRRYIGHFGYHVYPRARGRHLAERACRLLLPVAQSAGLDELWITCNPENLASRRSCERLGATLIETVPVPATHLLYGRGDREKCRYRISLTA